MVISGRLIEKTSQRVVAKPGDLFGEKILQDEKEIENIISEDECLILECHWENLLKGLKSSKDPYMSMHDLIILLKNQQIFTHLSDWKMFQLAESLKLVKFKNNDVIYYFY